MANTLLSRLVVDGGERFRLAFGVDATPVAVGDLVSAGEAMFSEQAEADRVGLLMTNDRPTVEVILGALATGSALVSLPLPGRGADLSAYASFVREVCEAQQISEIVVADEYADLLAGIGQPVRRHSERGSSPLAAPAGDGFRLVQFTSGSTGQPRPVVVDDARLGANVTAILSAVEPQREEAVVSWLPLAHDMGLVGMLLAGIAAGSRPWESAGDIVLLDPATFLRRPMTWLDALDRWTGTFTAAPDFGYRMAAHRARPDGLDLSPLRCAIVGGEIVRAETLTAFVDALRPGGLEATALCPAYGLAELGLAAAMTPPEQRWRALALSSAGLADDKVREARSGEPVTTLVASGVPLHGYDITCGSPEAGTAPIAVRGPSVGLDGRTGKGFAGDDGWFTTGDTGFVDDGGWLYVCGRTDDYLVAHGRNIYAPAVEAAVGEVDGVRPGRVTAVGLPSGEWAIVAESAERAPLSTEQAGALQREIRRSAVGVTTAKPDTVVLVQPGSLPLTSSGKLQRNHVRSLLVKDELAAIPRAARG